MMEPHARPPEPIDWLAAALRGLLPGRWIPCLMGLALMLIVGWGAQTCFGAQPTEFADWLTAPSVELQSLWETFRESGTVRRLFVVGPAAILLISAWFAIGAFITRREAIARQAEDPYRTLQKAPASPDNVFGGQTKVFWTYPTLLIFLIGVFMLPQLIAVGMSHFMGGVGAIIVAVLLPIVLIVNLVLLALAIGLTGTPLAPAAIAIENSDVFDALSRSFNYVFTKMTLFAFLLAAALVFAATPVAAIVYAVRSGLLNGPDWLVHGAFWLSLAISLSIFWSLNTLVYLHLRAAVDNVDSRELADEIAPAVEESKPKLKPTVPPTQSPLVHLQILLLFLGTWLITATVMNRWGGEQGNWLMWGLGDGFVPEVNGMHSAAAFIGLVWGIVWLLAPIAIYFRRVFPRDDAPAPSDAV